MSFVVPFDLGYEFEVKAGVDEVFDLLADVPESASHFPKLARLDKVGPKSYRWTMERIGPEHAGIQTVYASKYATDRKKGKITWTPVAGVGNAEVSGSWTIVAGRQSTQLTLRLRGELKVPFPALMEAILSPVIVAENEKLIETYIDNLIDRFGGEA